MGRDVNLPLIKTERCPMQYERLVHVATTSPEKQIRDQAFGELMRRFEPMVLYQANRTLNDPDKADDVAQNTFLEMYGKLHQIRDPKAFPGWLRRLVQTQCSRQVRRDRRSFVPLDDDAMQVAAEDLSPMERVEMRQRAERLRQAVDALPETERAAAKMYYYERMSQAEIATRLKIEPKTVKSRLHAARGRLKRTLTHRCPTLDRIAREGRPLLAVACHKAAGQIIQLPAHADSVQMAA